jgi:hypothetical protein
LENGYEAILSKHDAGEIEGAAGLGGNALTTSTLLVSRDCGDEAVDPLIFTPRTGVGAEPYHTGGLCRLRCFRGWAGIKIIRTIRVENVEWIDMYEFDE